MYPTTRTGIVGMLVCLCVLSGCGAGKSSSKTPGKKEFDAANSLITGKSKGIAHGNTESARKRAIDFGVSIGKLQKLAFTGGDKDRKLSLTGEEFLVYCQHSEEGVCFLVHIPQLKNYKDDVRVALAELAWATAKAVTEDLHKDMPGKLAVGLRGSMLYGALATGTIDNEPKIEQAYSVSTDALVPFFAAKAAVEPAAETKAAKTGT